MTLLNRYNGVIVLPADLDQPAPGVQRYDGPGRQRVEPLSEWADCPHCECYWDGGMCCDCGEEQD